MRKACSILIALISLSYALPAFTQNSASGPIIFTVAGGTFGDGGLATGIGIGQVQSLVADKEGNLYFADANNLLVRKVDTNGIVTTIAGTGIPLGPHVVDTDLYSPNPEYPNGEFGSFLTSVLTVDTYAGDGGTAVNAALALPEQVVLNGTGDIYILDGGTRIRKVDAHGIITTVAGNGIAGFSGDGGPATSAEIDIDRFQLDSAGNLYFTNTYLDSFGDVVDSRIRKVDTNGTITTLAGNGTPGYSGDGGPAPSAEIYAFDVVLDSAANLYFVDRGTRIRKVGTNGIITTVPGNGSLGVANDGVSATDTAIAASSDVAFDGSGNFYFVNQLYFDVMLCFDGLTLFCTDDARIHKVDTTGIITTVAGNGPHGFSGDGGPATKAAINPFGDVIYIGGSLYFVDGQTRIRKIDANGIITTIAGNGSLGFTGDGGPATSAEIEADGSYPPFVFDAHQNIYFVEPENFSSENNRLRRIDSNGVITTVAGNGTEGYNGDGSPATAKELDAPAGIAVDANSRLYIADSRNDRIIGVDAGGLVTTLAGTGMGGFCQSYQPDCAADGTAATGAQLSSPYSIALDVKGNFYFIDDFSRYTVRKVDPNGILSTVAGGGGTLDFATCTAAGDGGPATSACLSEPLGLAIDSAGDLFIGDTNDFKVRKVDSQGVITTIAGNGTAGFSGDGGPAISAEIGHPSGLAVDTSGNLYIGDGDNFRVRKVDTKGVITTVAGTGTTGFSGDGGLATSAQISGVNGLAVDKTGNLYIADPFNNRVRKVDPNGVITTYVGNGSIGFSGDGGPATDAMLTFPGGLAVDSSSALYVGDVFNYRVREVVAAFTLALNPTAIAIASPGEPGTTSITVTPAARFTGNVTLACTVAFVGTGSATKLPTCSLNSSMLSISGPGNVTSTLVVNTAPPLTPVTLALIGFLLIPFCNRRWALVLCLPLLCLVVICAAPIGCGGSGGVLTGSSIPGTTPGDYSVTITATSGAFSSSIVVPVTVK